MDQEKIPGKYQVIEKLHEYYTNTTRILHEYYTNTTRNYTNTTRNYTNTTRILHEYYTKLYEYYTKLYEYYTNYTNCKNIYHKVQFKGLHIHLIGL